MEVQIHSLIMSESFSFRLDYALQVCSEYKFGVACEHNLEKRKPIAVTDSSTPIPRLFSLLQSLTTSKQNISLSQI